MADEELTAIASEVVARTLRKLPQELRELARTVPVQYADYPDKDVIEQGFEEDLLGLFVGDPLGQGLHQDNPMPPQIILYLENIWDLSDDDTPTFRDEVKITYLHELGHYLGWDEEEVAARGLE